jgi:hypothetical protein
MAAAPVALTLSFNHEIFYSTENPVPAEEIAEALLALSRVVQRAPALLRNLVPGISAPKVQLLVDRLESGSLTETFVVKFFFGTQKKMDRAIKRCREALGVDLTSNGGIARTVIWGLVIFGAYYAITHSSNPAKPTVEISHNTIINIGAREIGMTPEALVKIIEATVQNKNQLASDAVKIIKPAKADRNAEIVLDGSDELKISRQTIAEVPAEFTPDKSEDSKTVQDLEIRLRAVDLDSTEHGWAAVVVHFSPRRLPLELGPGLNPDDLFGKKTIRGSIEAISRKDQFGKMQLKGYRLISISPEAHGKD